MRVAELLLRLGCTLVGWIIIYTHLLWLATLRVLGCDTDGDALWRLLLGFAPFTLMFAFALQLARPFAAVHELLRWLGVPLVVLIPLAIAALWPTLLTSTLGSEPICEPPAASWQRWWAPVQCLVLAVIAWRSIRLWTPVGSTVASTRC